MGWLGFHDSDSPRGRERWGLFEAWERWGLFEAWERWGRVGRAPVKWSCCGPEDMMAVPAAEQQLIGLKGEKVSARKGGGRIDGEARLRGKGARCGWCNMAEWRQRLGFSNPK